MASTNIKARNLKRKQLIEKHFEKRQELKKIVASLTASAEDKFQAMADLQAMPRDSSKVRYRKRCQLTGRSRGNLSRFGLCRNEFRRLAHMGHITGVRKASW